MMADFTGFSEASLLYADNYYLVERLERIFKKDQGDLLQSFRKIIQDKEWMSSGEWSIHIPGRYFELRYETPEGKQPFFIYLKFTPRDLANKEKEEGKDGERRTFEIALAAREDAGNIKEFRKNFFEKANKILQEGFEQGREYYSSRTTGQALVKREVVYTLEELLTVMEAEVENFVKIAVFAK